MTLSDLQASRQVKYSFADARVPESASGHRRVLAEAPRPPGPAARVEAGRPALDRVKQSARRRAASFGRRLRGARRESEPRTPAAHDGRIKRVWNYYLCCGVAAALLGNPSINQALFSGEYHADHLMQAVALGLGWITAYALRRERVERAQLMQIFSSHVSPLLAENLWARRNEYLSECSPRKQRLTATTLFLDMKGYTEQAGRMEPDRLMDWVNTFMNGMAERVAARGGLVDDFFGDGLKADFGIPVARHTEAEIRQDALNAVLCAVEMGEQLARLNAAWGAAGLPGAGIRIGIHTGEAVAGYLGGKGRLKYTTVGADVILAQRLESYADGDHDFSREPFRILVSEATYRRVADRVDAICLGPVQLKGRAEPSVVYKVLGLRRQR